MIYWIRKYFSDPAEHWRALSEVLTVFLFSIIPLGISSFRRLSNSNTGVKDAFVDLFGHGEMYLLAYALYGSIFWLAFMKGDRPRHGARAFLGAVATLMILPIVGYFAVDPTFTTIQNPDSVRWSYKFYGALLLINYLLIFYMHIDPPNPSAVFDREAMAMRDRYRSTGA